MQFLCMEICMLDIINMKLPDDILCEGSLEIWETLFEGKTMRMWSEWPVPHLWLRVALIPSCDSGSRIRPGSWWPAQNRHLPDPPPDSRALLPHVSGPRHSKRKGTESRCRPRGPASLPLPAAGVDNARARREGLGSRDAWEGEKTS